MNDLYQHTHVSSIRGQKPGKRLVLKYMQVSIIHARMREPGGLTPETPK